VDSPKKIILCVDDEAVIVLAMKQELRRRFGDRFGIESALNADAADKAIEALEASGSRVALVLCDWHMPGRLGDQFLIELRARKPDIKSILLTGQSDKDTALRVVEAGVFACLQKPWRSVELVALIESCLAE
jgi:CheY-like chemotaxis protein